MVVLKLDCGFNILREFYFIFLPKRAAEGMVEAELEMGVCFMIIGRDEGKFRP